MGILNNPAILRIRVPFQDFQAMEILNLERLRRQTIDRPSSPILRPTSRLQLSEMSGVYKVICCHWPSDNPPKHRCAGQPQKL